MIGDLSSYNRFLFNWLPSIQAADAALHQHRYLDVAFAELGPIFAKYDICDTWGICLLHNHWVLKDNEFPVQHISLRGQTQEFITIPRSDLVSGSFWPSVISVSRMDTLIFHPLEYSTDQYVCAANSILAKRPSFLKEFGSRLVSTELANIFGLVALRNTTDSALELLEFNFIERISIVREVNMQDHVGENTIQTAWKFHSDSASLGCEASCFQRCSDPGDGTHRDDGHAKAHGPTDD